MLIVQNSVLVTLRGEFLLIIVFCSQNYDHDYQQLGSLCDKKSPVLYEKRFKEVIQGTKGEFSGRYHNF